MTSPTPPVDTVILRNRWESYTPGNEYQIGLHPATILEVLGLLDLVDSLRQSLAEAVAEKERLGDIIDNSYAAGLSNRLAEYEDEVKSMGEYAKFWRRKCGEAEAQRDELSATVAELTQERDEMRDHTARMTTRLFQETHEPTSHSCEPGQFCGVDWQPWPCEVAKMKGWIKAVRELCDQYPADYNPVFGSNDYGRWKAQRQVLAVLDGQTGDGVSDG